MATFRRWWMGGAFVLLAAAGGGAYYYYYGTGQERPAYRFATVERGRVVSAVSASGTLRAVVTVEVGSQVSGQIKELAADFNTVVRAGQVIARLDPAQFEANVRQAQAELAVARANVTMQEATLAELEAQAEGDRAALAEAREDLKRKQALAARKVVSASEVDKATAVHDQARARVSGTAAGLRKQRAQIEHAQAQVMEREAGLQHQQIDLEHTIIRSPVDGVVISRNVDIGQTVAASLQAPVLFTIAQDLSSMQVEVSVDEADIGQIVDGQTATFTVDSFPGREFPGLVKQVRMAPVEVSNVITYTVVVSAENPDLRLLPGMTANVSIVVSERDSVLKVPNAALRFRPEGTGAEAPATSDRATGAPDGRARASQAMQQLTEQLSLNEEQQAGIRAIFAETMAKIRAMRDQGMPPDEMRLAIQQARAANRPRVEALLTEEQRQKYRALVAMRSANPIQRGRVWVPGDDGAPKPVEISYGVSDGSVSEIVRGDIAEGQKVIVGIARETAEKNGTSLRFGL